MLVAKRFEEDDLFDFDDDGLLLRLEKLFGDDDLTNDQRPRKGAIAPNQRSVAVSLIRLTRRISNDIAG